MEQWKEYKLGEVCSRLRSGKSIKADYVFNDGKYPVIGGNGIRGYADVSNFYGQAAVIGRQGAYCGNVRFFEGEAYMTEHAVVAVGNELADTRFLACLLSLMHLGNLSAQSAQPGISVQTLSKQLVHLPSISYQKKVSAILKSLDDKIEVNRRINDNLEQQAQALFKSWFVDFEPFKDGEFVESELGMIPKGWRVGKLEEILFLKRDNVKKDNVKDYPYLPIDIIPMKSLGINEFKSNNEAQSSLQVFEKNDIIIGAMRVYFHRVVIAPQKGITRNTCFVLKPKYEDSLAFCILLCNTDNTIEYANRTSKGSTMPYAVWEGGLDSYKFILPPYEIITNFNKVCLPLINKIRDKYKECNKLSKLRDILLPRLMSGELKLMN